MLLNRVTKSKITNVLFFCVFFFLQVSRKLLYNPASLIQRQDYAMPGIFQFPTGAVLQFRPTLSVTMQASACERKRPV